MSYTYINGIYEVTTAIRNGFKRFHSMNAQYKFERFGWVDYYRFVSYATPILWASHNYGTDKWRILINWESYDCSKSTIRQLTRFMRENDFPISHIGQIRDAFDTNSHVVVFSWGTIEFCTDSKMRLDFPN